MAGGQRFRRQGTRRWFQLFRPGGGRKKQANLLERHDWATERGGVMVHSGSNEPGSVVVSRSQGLSNKKGKRTGGKREVHHEGGFPADWHWKE